MFWNSQTSFPVGCYYFKNEHFKIVTSCIKWAVGLHLVFNYDGHFPSFIVITKGNISDVKVAHLLSFDPGAIVVDDRGYNDYRLFGKWTDQCVSFATWMKNNTRYEGVKEQEISKNGHILKDEVIHLTGTKANARHLHPLRWIGVCNPEKDEFEHGIMPMGKGFGSEIKRNRCQHCNIAPFGRSAILQPCFLSLFYEGFRAARIIYGEKTVFRWE